MDGIQPCRPAELEEIGQQQISGTLYSTLLNLKKVLLWLQAVPLGEQRGGWISAPILQICGQPLQPLALREKKYRWGSKLCQPHHRNSGDEYPHGPGSVDDQRGLSSRAGKTTFLSHEFLSSILLTLLDLTSGQGSLPWLTCLRGLIHF